MRRVRCNGCGRFCKWDSEAECWGCDDCAREYHEPPPKRFGAQQPPPPITRDDEGKR